MAVKSNNNTFVATLNTVNPSEMGRSQLGRHIKALSRTFFNIEPRTVEAWLKYLSVLAKQVNYIDERTLSASGTWENLLPEPQKLAGLAQLVQQGSADEQIKQLASRPDMALLLTFIDLLQHSNAQFNQFVARHLEHFYHEILRFKPLPASADSAHVVVSLNNVDALTLPAGTQFDGGKDTQGSPLVYSTDEVVTINKAAVDYVASVNKIKSSEQLSLNHQILLDSEQGILLEQSEATFGQGLDELTSSTVEVGFKIASQDLFLSGGTRIVSLDFGEQAQLLNWLTWFDFYISTSDGLLAVDVTQLNVVEQQLQLTFDNLFPAITALEGMPIGADNALPFIALVLKSEHYQQLYSDESSVFARFNSFTITQMSLTTQVSGLAGVIANNAEVDLDTSKPFEPFGIAPRLASKVHFTHPELVTKNITHASVEFAWLDRPNSFNDYYRAYSYYYSEQYNLDERYFDSSALCGAEQPCEGIALSVDTLFSTDCNCLTWPDTVVNITRSDAGSDAQISLELFYNEGDDNLPDVHNNIAINTLTFTHNDNNSMRDFQLLPLDEPTASKWPKYYTLALSEQDFAHKDYTKVIELFAYKNAGSDNPVLVNAPYTPVLDSLTLRYHSESITSPAQRVGNAIYVEHIAPVGRPTEQLTQQSLLSLLPKIEEFGYLYMALSQVSTPGQVRMYYQVDPVDGYNMGDNPAFVWEYFNAGSWHRFKREDSQGGSEEGRVLRDSTYDLLDSGLVVFYLPKLSQSSSFNHDGKLWIRAKLSHNRAEVPSSFDNQTFPIYSKLKGVFTQGVRVSLTSQGNDASHFEQPLVSESISKLVLPNPSVDTIMQPFASFGAKVAETTDQFDRRISERLHHRQRLISGWDYEHFVLQAFSQLHSVRPVVNSSGLSLVVVPLNHDVSVLQPKVPRYLKRQIREQVNALSVPNLTVEIDDPNYVEVQLELIVKIDPLYDIQSTVIELNDMVVDALTPWNKLDKPLERTIYLAPIAQVLETHPAVDMIQVIRATKKGQTAKQYSVISADNPHDILVPARNHKISLANTLGDVFEGIGKWEIELDFVVQ
ncbi:hypothetical protein PSECIP111951_00939 [Pseudoalteromonas holothuriae]|uniref:Baseplate protein J-like domain-containing protein n=1 Tax=Pseudoalteromonas holothuriae TaxID=2963714 RepID=A0ABN8UIB9_9GAMM|nr:hypothetical protein [Pseudoalteromonas sp. CIP111951]CAH9054007.1 hypothetical protein PSECIP111951_00939 [Pseudoalteromonas sp. CIP111951]